MFTGIIRGIGRIADIVTASPRRLAIETGGLSTAGWRVGDSVSVSGVCLTVVALAGRRFDAELSGETIERTTLGRLAPGARVNLEPSLAAADPMGGHLVTGHVDGIARVGEVAEVGGTLCASIAAPAGLSRFIARKGSVTLDGVSLTIGEVAGTVFRIDLVPQTRSATTLGSLAQGQALNLEIDLVARYLDRLLDARGGT
ncbi:MAG: riboflavin synthase [Steroidobacteraceae bacterium]